jgi:hypothetical protein
MAGRPTDYLPSFDDQAYRLCLLGATDADLAGFFDVTETTINNWKIAQPSFFESIKSGKLQADAHIALKLFNRAEGAEWIEEQAIKIKVGQHEERVEIVQLRRAAPPDTTAAIFWLKNRQPRFWRDKVEAELTGKDGAPLIPTAIQIIGIEPRTNDQGGATEEGL